MQKVATRLFIYSSISFGVLGILMVLTDTEPGDTGNVLQEIIGKLFICTIFIILPSFALSVAGKYLKK